MLKCKRFFANLANRVEFAHRVAWPRNYFKQRIPVSDNFKLIALMIGFAYLSIVAGMIAARLNMSILAWVTKGVGILFLGLAALSIFNSYAGINGVG